MLCMWGRYMHDRNDMALSKQNLTSLSVIVTLRINPPPQSNKSMLSIFFLWVAKALEKETSKMHSRNPTICFPDSQNHSIHIDKLWVPREDQFDVLPKFRGMGCELIWVLSIQRELEKSLQQQQIRAVQWMGGRVALTMCTTGRSSSLFPPTNKNTE